MNNRTFYNEVLTEHNLHPAHKHELEDANMTCEGLNPSCGDDIWVHLDVDDNGIIQKGAFEGDGCAISQASDELEEAASLQDIAHMPARVKCAVLGWHTLKEMLTGEADHANPQPVSTENH